MKAFSNKKFSLSRYRDQSDWLSLIFDLPRHSLKELGDKGFRRFMENSRRPEDAKIEKFLAFIKKDPEMESAFIPSEIKQRHRKKMSQKLPISRSLKWAEYKGHALLGLNSSELIIRVALFETFLKEIHRQTLLAKPQLLSLVKPNRQIPLKDIFHGGFERFKLTEIDRQVREADRLKTGVKAKFFERRLKLPWGKDSDVARIEYLVNLRHELVHANHSTPVTDNDIKDTRELLFKTLSNCVGVAAKIYSTHFASY
jgi:hypothetical protein